MINTSLRISLIAVSLFYSFALKAQAPNSFNYQAVARNASGLILPNTAIGIRMSIHDISSTGTVVFQETHSIVTNDFGLFNISIGTGTSLIGSLGAVDWSNGAKYIEIEGDLNGGTTYTTFGTSELLSVPYALYSNSAAIPLLPNGTSIGNTPYWDGSTWITNSSNIHNAGTRVGIGTGSPLQKMHVVGNINIDKDSSFMINNQKVLWVKGAANLFAGINSGASNSIGFSNSFLGFNAGTLNLSGSQNTFVGAETGSANINGEMNSFFGRRAGFGNVDGIENTFIGAYAGQSNTDGMHNSFLGVTTGSSNTSGQENTFIGAHAGYFNSFGSYNVFLGNFSGLTNTSGNYNTIVGFEADAASSNLSNASAFGTGAIVNASNSIMIGNTAVTSIGGQVGWSTFSDKRLKSDISECNLGLEFITQLNPVNYTYRAPGQENIIYSGLIAQDVESALTNLNTDFSGLVRPKNENDFYSIRYAEFVVPLINSIQEQEVKISDLTESNLELLKRIEDLETKLNKLVNTTN